MPDAAKLIRIGRDADCDLVIKNNTVSRRHAELVIEPGGGLEIVDLRSSGGTFLLRDGKQDPIVRARLRKTDSLKLGEYQISVQELLAMVQKRPRSAPVRHPAAQPAAPQGRMVRCSCGTVKKRGTKCPACGL